MKHYREFLEFNTSRRREYINITASIEQALQRSAIREGLILVSAMHITASVYINDAEPGLKLLAELTRALNANPGLSIAALLERYRNTREGSILEQLAQWRPEGPDEDYQFEAEFADILSYLRRRDNLRRRDDPDKRLLETLLRRSTPRTLSAEERETLRNLGKSKKV